jgi:hypothetical protein
MSKKFFFYLVKEDGAIEGTNDPGIADAAAEDGSTVVIDVRTGKAVFDSEESEITTAERSAWLEDEGEDEGDEGDEGEDE